MAKGLLLVGLDFSRTAEDEFHDWYDLEHLPERQRVAGFGLCERWIDTANPKQALATYDLDSLAVLQSDAYRAIGGANLSPWSKRLIGKCGRLIRFEGEQLVPGDAPAPAGAGGLLLVSMHTDPEHEADFNAWYNEEHLPGLAAVPGVLAARRYRDPTGSQKYAAIYHLASPEVVTSDAWKAVATSDWTARLRPHFRNFIRVLSRRYLRGS